MTELEESNIISAMKLSSRKEDYLETIYRLSSRIESVGISDIARERGVTLPTVKSAMTKLKKDGLVTQRHYGKVVLTETGRLRAEQVYKAHKTIRAFLHKILELPEEVAEAEACKMEHGLSLLTLERLRDYVNKELEMKGRR